VTLQEIPFGVKQMLDNTIRWGSYG
jgi:hypothetical protein